MRDNRDLNVEQWRADRLAEQRLVAVVIRIRDERDTGRQQFPTRGFDIDLLAVVCA